MSVATLPRQHDPAAVTAPAVGSYQRPLDRGAVVRVAGIPELSPHTLFVVVRVMARSYTLAVLGGGDGRVWTGIPAAALRSVDIATIVALALFDGGA